ncbi:arginase family protein [Flavitalea flava]
MLFLNPQWQGAGKTRELETGARVLSAYLREAGLDMPLTEVPLSGLPDDTLNGIQGYLPICEQLDSFHQLLASLPADKGLSGNGRFTEDGQYPERLSTIGGDCGIEVIPISYLNDCYNGELTVLWFDGHADLNSVVTSPSGHFHGMPVRVLLGEGDDKILKKAFSILQPSQFIYIGVNDMDAAEVEYIREYNIDLIETPDLKRITDSISRKKKRNIYIHFDLDVLSAKDFSHTPYPNKTGFGVADSCRIIEGLKKDFHIAGSSVTESIADDPDKLRPIGKLLKELIY